MSFFSRVSSKVSDTSVQQSRKLANRFVGDGGFTSCGATYHAPRTNSSEEIINSLKLIAKSQADSAVKTRKALVEADTFNLSVDAAKSGRDIVDLAIERQNQYTAELNGIISRGGTLSDIQKDKHRELSKLSEMAVSVKRSELKSSEICKFLKIAGAMPQRHLSLAHDVVDLSNMYSFINREIFPTVDFNTIGQINGTNVKSTLMGYILNLLPGLSKANPKAVNLAEAVVSHSDDTNARFFLSKFVDQFPVLGTEKQAEATEQLVGTLAKSVLRGMPSMDLGPNSKEQVFFNQLMHLCSEDSKPENIKLLKQTLDMTDSVAPQVDAMINIDDIRVGDSERIAENIKVLPQVLENVEAKGLKTFDVSGFLTKNINLN